MLYIFLEKEMFCMMPLAYANIGERCTVKRVGGKDQVRRHLAGLGFVENGQVQIVSRSGGNFIVSVKDSRIAISKEMAQKIMI